MTAFNEVYCVLNTLGKLTQFSTKRYLYRYCYYTHFTDKETEEEKSYDITGKPVEHWVGGMNKKVILQK